MASIPVLRPAGGVATGPESTQALIRQSVRLSAEVSLRRRRLLGRITQSTCLGTLLLALAPIAAELGYTVYRGGPGLSIGFLAHAPTPPEVPGGGISTAIIGSAEITGMAIGIAVPISLLAALYLRERPGRLSTLVSFGADVATGIPSIVVGIFAYSVIVRPSHHFSDFAAGFAIAVLMTPIMIRANEAALRTVPNDHWEAGIALGARRSSVARRVILRGAAPGLIVGNLLAIARGVGETAPLLFTVVAPTAVMTLLIYSDSTQAFASAQQTAWSTALVLIAFVVLLSIVARVIAASLSRNARKH
jgi:phosphate transport system permease protein